MTRGSCLRIALVGFAVAASLLTLLALDGDAAFAQGKGRFHANLAGFQESPAVLSPGRGVFDARLSDDGTSLEYKLSYQNLLTSIFMAHIHIAQPDINGGIVIWLCDNDPATAPNDPTGLAPACDGTTSGEVEGTVDADNVVAVVSQGVGAMDFPKVIRALRAGLGYANVHTTSSPGGEIRGQIRGGGGPPH